MLDFIIKNSMFIMKAGAAVGSAACGGGGQTGMCIQTMGNLEQVCNGGRMD